MEEKVHTNPENSSLRVILDADPKYKTANNIVSQKVNMLLH